MGTIANKVLASCIHGVAVEMPVHDPHGKESTTWQGQPISHANLDAQTKTLSEALTVAFATLKAEIACCCNTTLLQGMSLHRSTAAFCCIPKTMAKFMPGQTISTLGVLPQANVGNCHPDALFPQNLWALNTLTREWMHDLMIWHNMDFDIIANNGGQCSTKRV